MSTNMVLSAWKDIFARKNYIVLFAFFAAGIYILNVFVSNARNIFYSLKSDGLFNTLQFCKIIILNFWKTIELYSAISMLIISLMTAMLLCIIICKFNMTKQKEKRGFLVGSAMFLGFLVPGCAACGIGLAATLGLAATFTYLPFRGMELSIITILVLGYAIWKSSKDFYTCKLRRNR